MFLFWAQVISELLKTKGYKGRDSILLYELEKHHFQVFLGSKKQFDFFSTMHMIKNIIMLP